MEIGIPREIKDGEARVGATPEMVRSLKNEGHFVLVETGAGLASGYEDASYREAGAGIANRPEEIYACPLIVKVKELQPDEFTKLQPGTILFGFQQLARDPRLLDAVIARRITGIAYENVLGVDGSRPMLAPMSTIAGLMSVQIAQWALQRREGPLSGSGVLLPHLDGVAQGRVLIVGEGVAGSAAARAFLAVECAVTVLGQSPARLRTLEEQLVGCRQGTFRTGLATPEDLALRSSEADVVIGAVSVPGRLAPKLITREMLRAMRPGSVFIDIGIDMGGIAETSRQTKISDPMYMEEGVLHYCVPNIPALVPRTATQALTTATLPYLRLLAERGLEGAVRASPGLREGLLVHEGQVVHQGLAEDTSRVFVPYMTDGT
jgi:alanine dehydrogenase